MSDIFDRLKSALADRYAIEEEVGAGGMATVYLAEDLKHHRKVAVKVLRPELAAALGPERFLREIEIAARLQHPHILPLHDSGEADGFLYYVMPYVKGESLRERLAQHGELPIADAVKILRDVVDALAHAHEQGVVHRDIKPDNVMLSGRHALVTDFGVAKAVSEATGRGKLTTAGVALGTPAYMAPEQATADPTLDHRADIYAVGAVGYEMLAGRPPFTGTTPQMILAAHVTEAVEPVTKHRKNVPHALNDLILRCLEKKPADRWQSAEELLPQLEALATPSGGITPTGVMAIAGVRRPRRFAFGVITVFGVVGGFLLIRALGGLFAPTAPSLNMGPATRITTEEGLEIHPDISPDGDLVAFAAGTSLRMRIFIRSVAGGRTIPLTDDTSAAQSEPRWSPDGTQLLFLARGGVYVAPQIGGPARLLVSQVNGAIRSATWSPTGEEVAVVRRDSLEVRPVEGEDSRFLARYRDLHSCTWSPDGRWIACVSGNGSYMHPGPIFGNKAPSQIVLIPSEGGRPLEVTDASALHQSPVWAPDGGTLYFVSDRDGPRDIYGVRLSRDGEVRSEPLRLTTGLNAQSIALNGDGTRIAYSVYTARSNVWSLPIPAVGPISAAAAQQVTSGNQTIETMRVSWDGRWLLYDSDIGGNSDIYRIPLAGGQSERLTTHLADDFGPDLSPDGREVAFYSLRSGTRDIFVRSLDDGRVQQLTDSPGQETFPVFSPDGSAVAAWDQDGSGRLYIIRRNDAGGWEDPVERATPAHSPKWSHDGQYIAFSSGGGVYVIPTETGDRVAIYEPRPDSDDPRAGPVEWSADEAELYFKSHVGGQARLYSVPAAGGRPRLLVRFDDPLRPSNRIYFAADGERFYFAIDDKQSDIWVAEVIQGG